MSSRRAPQEDAEEGHIIDATDICIICIQILHGITPALQEKAKNKKERQTNRAYAKLANDPKALKVEVKANPSAHSDVC